MPWSLQMNVDNVGSFVFEDASLFPAAKVRNCCTPCIPSRQEAAPVTLSCKGTIAMHALRSLGGKSFFPEPKRLCNV